MKNTIRYNLFDLNGFIFACIFDTKTNISFQRMNSTHCHCTIGVEEVKPCYSHRIHVIYITLGVKVYTTLKLTLQNIIGEKP